MALLERLLPVELQQTEMPNSMWDLFGQAPLLLKNISLMANLAAAESQS